MGTRSLEELEAALTKNEKDLEDLRTQKTEAVTAEDFDKATDLKNKEKKMVAEQDAIKETIALRKSEAEKKEEAKEEKKEETKEEEKKEETKEEEKKEETK